MTEVTTQFLRCNSVNEIMELREVIQDYLKKNKKFVSDFQSPMINPLGHGKGFIVIVCFKYHPDDGKGEIEWNPKREKSNDVMGIFDGEGALPMGDNLSEDGSSSSLIVQN